MEVSATAPKSGTYSIQVSDGFDGSNTGAHSLYETIPTLTYLFLPVTVNARAGLALDEARLAGRDARGTSRSREYTVLIGDGFNGTLTGEYRLFVQRLNAPEGAASAAFGEIASGEIGEPGEMDAFTFTADAGDRVLIAASRTPGELWPGIRLFDPHGGLLNSASDPVHVEASQGLPCAGAYAVLIGDGFRGTETGGYTLYLQRLNEPENASALPPGGSASGSIEKPAQMDCYTFEGSAGDDVRLEMSRISGTLWPEMRLYDPQGNELATASGPSTAQISQRLTVSGGYSVLVGDGFRGTETGEYLLQLE